MPDIKAKSALPYVRRLLEDQYVQEQLREAAVGLRSAYARASAKRASAADDKKFYDGLRRSAASIRNAVVALPKAEPPPPRRGRKLVILTLTGGSAVLLARWASKQRAATVDDSEIVSTASPSAGYAPEPESVTTRS